MKTIFIVALSIVLGVSMSTAQKKKTVATMFKPVGTVEHKTESKDWSKAKPATPLISGDLVRTGENSFAIIKFLENSVLRVQEKSEVTVNGEIAKGEFSKNVFLQQGELGFNVKKRPNEKFEFSTPTSVASIRGTGGLLIAGQDSNDVLILGSGTVDLRNLISNFSATLNAGQTAYSMSNGSIKIEQSTDEEMRLLNQGTPDDPDSGKTEGSNVDPDSGSTSGSGISIGMTISAPVSKENQDLTVTVEISQSSITMDSLSKTISDFSLFYRSKPDQLFKPLKSTLSGRTAKFTIPAAEVFAPTLQVYASLRLQDGSEFTSPSQSPESNPVVLPVQAGVKNEIRIEFTDPNGKKKTMVIEYK
ncbi:MAG: FecR family protein [Bacteroidota bacterium]